MDSIYDKARELDCEMVVADFAGAVFKRGVTACPLPDHLDKTPSFSVDKKRNRWTCFGCNKSGSTIDFVVAFRRIEPSEAVEILAQTYHIDTHPHSGKGKVDKIPTKGKTGQPDASLTACQRPKKPASPSGEAIKQHKAYIERCFSDRGKTDYLHKRGFTDDTISRFSLGYDTDKRAVIIPYSKKFEYHIKRLLFPPDPKKPYRKPDSDELGGDRIFNVEALKLGGVVFVVESQLCAISIAQAGGASVALGGTNGIRIFVEAVKEAKSNCILVLCLDNDEQGAKAQKELEHELEKLKTVRFISIGITDECKDPNELLVADSERLAANIRVAIAKAKDAFRTDKDSISFADLCRKKLPPLKWAIKKLFPVGLHMIASMPKVGKSWMALGMCYAVANGIDYLGFETTKMGTLYYSLEDNENSAQERMLDYSTIIGTAPPENAHLILDADRTDTGFFKKLKEELVQHPDIGFVVVDTLQNIRGAEMKKGDVYGNDVAELKKIKRFAIEHKLVIVLVHHLRKAKDDDDPFNNILGSNGLWGTIDTGITLAKKHEDDAEAKMKFKGRGIRRGELIITLGDSGLWQIVGTPAQQEAMVKKREYDDNPVIKTIKWLVSKSPYSWEGSASDLMMAAFDMDGVPKAITSESIGKTISRHKMDLYQDGITAESGRTSSKRQYKIYKSALRPKQYGFFASKEK